MNIADILMSLLRSEIAECGCDDAVTKEITPDVVGELFRVADLHDVSQIIFSALAKRDLISADDEIFSRFAEAEELSYFRLKRLEFSQSETERALDEAGIDHITLKGSVMRAYYPSPLMRMSADIDILVREADLDRAVSLLSEKLGYEVRGKKDFHDISLYTPDGMHLELHYNIMENDERLDPVLQKCWNYVRPVPDKLCKYEFTPEFFAFHLITHMTYHFINGGCGIKPFSDLWLYRHKVEYDESLLVELCRDCGIERFYENAVRLSEVWFGGEAHSELTQRMEAHVIYNAYGGEASRGIVVRQSKSGGKFGYLMGRIFAPYGTMKIRYPVLKKCPILLPFFWVVRWFALLFGDKTRVKDEMKMSKSVSKEQVAKMMQFLDSVGLGVE